MLRNLFFGFKNRYIFKHSVKVIHYFKTVKNKEKNRRKNTLETTYHNYDLAFHLFFGHSKSEKNDSLK
jgi:hypothetical protein